MPAKTAIILVNYKTPWYLDKCLESIFKYTTGFHIYLVHNSRDKASLDVGKKFESQYPEQITTYMNEQNLGFVGGVNIPFAEAVNHERICLVNSDVIVTKDWLQLMNSEMDANPHIAQIVPDSNCYYPDSMFWKIMKVLPWGLSRLQILQMQNPARSPDFRGFKADTNFLAIAGGFCVLFKTEHIRKLGYILDPNLAHGYWDDLDLTLYLRQFGQVGSTNKAYVFHFTNASFRFLGGSRKDPRKQQMADLNGFYIFQKWKKYFEEHISKLSPEELYPFLRDNTMRLFTQYYALSKLHPGFEDYVASLPAKKIWAELSK